MPDTKEKILMTALELFAQDGYEAVSVSMIAGELGMTKSALYKHYQNKRDIFDHIVARMTELDNRQARESQVPEGTLTETPEEYRRTTPEQLRDFTLAQYRFWTGDEFASNYRKMLTLEQYRNGEMNRLYQSCLVSGPVQYLEDLFREMISRGILRPGEPKQLAVEFFAPLFLLIQMSDGEGGLPDAGEILTAQMERFFEHWKGESLESED